MECLLCWDLGYVLGAPKPAHFSALNGKEFSWRPAGQGIRRATRHVDFLPPHNGVQRNYLQVSAMWVTHQVFLLT